MSRKYGATQRFDVKADGSTSVALTPGTGVVSAEFTVQAPKGGVEGNWPIALGAMMKITTDIDQTGSGSIIQSDDFPRIMDSFNVQSPWLGLLMDRQTYTGPIAKHLVEFTQLGYTYADGGTIAVPVADNDTNICYYQWLPFAHEAFEKPHHFGWWLGWLTSTTITAYLAPSTAIAAASAGAVIEAPCTVYCWIDYIASSELIMPTVSQWHLYQQAASGGDTMLLQGIGTKHGLADVLDGSRIAGMFQLFSPKGMGGPTTADNVTKIAIPQIGMDLTQNIDGFFSDYRRTMGGHRGPISSSATVPSPDRGADPYGVLTTVLTTLNDAGAMYMPVRFCGLDQDISKIIRVGGDIEVNQSFTTAPTSGKHSWVLNELRELGKDKKKELVGRTGKKGAYSLERIWSSGTPDVEDLKRHPNKAFAIPQRVVFSG